MFALLLIIEMFSIRLSEAKENRRGFQPQQEREYRDAVKLRYDWPFDDIPSVGVDR